MAWFFLILAGLLDVAWAVGLKYTDGFTRPVPSLLTGAAIVGSMYFLALSVRSLPLGTAYVIWGGIGTVGTVLFGIVLFDEPSTAARLACIGLIVLGTVGLKVA